MPTACVVNSYASEFQTVVNETIYTTVTHNLFYKYMSYCVVWFGLLLWVIPSLEDLLIY